MTLTGLGIAAAAIQVALLVGHWLAEGPVWSWLTRGS
jgi:hypothetical protein